MRPLVRSLLAHATNAGERALRWPVVAAAVLALLSLGPRLAAAQATQEGKACVELVDDFVEGCADFAWYIEYPCLWLGGVGYMLCVLVDIVVILGGSVSLPSPI